MEQNGKGNDWRYIWNGMWYIVVTVTVVGFGDIFPVTHIGKTICVIAVLLGDILIALMVVSLSFSSEFNP